MSAIAAMPRSSRPRRPPEEETPPARRAGLPLLVGAGLVLAVGFVWVMLAGSYDQYAALLIGTALVVLTIPIARHGAKVEQWPALSGILMLAMLSRIGGSIARYVVAYGAYGGVADASTYTQVATKHYHSFRNFHLFTPGTGVFNGLVPWLDTVIYALFGPTELGAFLIFSWISFIGTYLFYRAFRIGFPGGDSRRYAALVFFLPSLLYWPSSLGKEAWMMLAIGLASCGLARAIVGRPAGYVSLVAGIGAMLLVRPHLALIFLPAAVLAFLFRGMQSGTRRRPIGRLVGIAVLVLSSLVVISKAESYFGIKSLDVQTVAQQLQTTRIQTAEGNSAFNPPNAQSPTGFPEAVVTVLFRPFPFEAHSAAVLVASLEGLVLLGLTLASRRRLLRLGRAMKESPYVIYALLFSLLFVFAFSNFSNFGILARERVQMLPLFLVILAVPAAAVPVNPKVGRVFSRRRPSRSDSGRHTAERQLPSYRGPAPRSTTHATRARTTYERAGCYRGLGFRFDVLVGGTRADELRQGIDWALEGLRSREHPEHRYRLTAVERDGALRVRIEQDGRTIEEAVPLNRVATALTSDLNQRAISSRPERLNFHAGAVAFKGHAILIPGPSGAGKSTLTAALVSIGCGYLTDEAASLDLETLEVEPYQKPLSLASRSLSALGYHEWPSFEWADREMVPASHIRPSPLPPATPVGVVVFPRFEPGAPTSLEPMRRAEAIVELVNNSFNFVDHGGAWLEPLKRLVVASSCWRLCTGDANEAARMALGG